MKDNEIIKALERCGFDEDMCLDCPIQCDCEKDTEAMVDRAKAILNLINRLQTENKELHDAFYNKDRIKVVQTKAIKEFAERLKEKAHTQPIFDTYCGNKCMGDVSKVYVADIDNLVKEMVEGK